MWKLLIQFFDQIPMIVLLVFDILIALFIVVANGGFILATIINAMGLTLIETILLSIILLLWSAVSITGFVSVFKKKLIAKTVFFHSIIFAITSIGILGWAISLLYKVPAKQYVWGCGGLTFFCTYSAYLLRRAVLHEFVRESSIAQNLHVIVLIVAMIVDLSVYSKLQTILS